MGGEITWKCITSGPNAGKFKFYVILYRECGTGTAGAPSSVTLSSNSPAGSIACPKVGSGVDVSPNCYTSSGEISCGTVASGLGAVEEHKYESGFITINGTPPASGWYFSFTSCCRPTTTTNIPGSQSYTIRAYMYPYTVNGAALNTYPCYDSSPKFLEPPMSVICTGYEYTYAHNAFDTDLDSIYYDWGQALSTSLTANVNWNTGYAYNNPLPNGGSPATFNNQTGAITFNPSTGGSFATCVKVEAYRCNQKIAEIFRDIPIVLKNNCGANDPPTMNITNYPNYPQVVPVVSAGDTIYWETTVFAGQDVKFDLAAQDPQLLPNFSPQTIKFDPTGGQFGVPLNNPLTGCLNPPCATVVPKSPQTTYTNPLNNEVSFFWETDCSHISYQTTLCGTPTNRYVFALRMQDDFCPAPAINVASLVINVVSTIPVPPDASASCVSMQPNGSIDIDWLTPLDTGMNFDAYVVFHSTALNGPYAPLDTIWNYSTLAYNHATPGPAGNYYYLRTLGGCNLTSEPSDTLSLMHLALTAIPPTQSYIAQLDWTKPSSSSNSYEVWRQPIGGAWSMIGTTSDTTYNDTVTLCGNDLKYEIRINGGCISSPDSGYFSDQTNSDVLEIDSITVDGGASISWSGNTNDDVVSYDLLRLDPSGNWTSILNVPAGTPMPIAIPGALPDSQVDRYKVISTDSCGNQSSDLLVAAHNNILLTENSDPCDGELKLRWNSYNGWADGVTEYRIMADVTPPGGPTQAGVLFGTNNANDTTYRTKNIIGGWTYCFYVRAIDTVGDHSARSNEICINGLTISRSRLLYTAKASVKNDNSIEMTTYIDKDADVIHYDIQRADAFGGPFTSLGLVPKPLTAPWEIQFSDFTADPHHYRYTYRVVATDSCGGFDTVSNIATNVLLKVESKENLTNVLNWNHYRDYMGYVGGYEVYRAVGRYGNFQYVGKTTDTMFTDNVRPLGDNAGVFCYKVIAVEEGNPLMFLQPDGQTYRSISNVACAEHAPRVFIPSSFNPISNEPENRVWKPVHSYVHTYGYRLKIYDRWGNVVFSTSDEHAGWDGTINGEQAQTGVYVYDLQFRSVEGMEIKRKGNITLFYREQK